jgi:hypothetical protein
MKCTLHTALAVIPGNTGFSLCAISQNGTHIVKLACRPPAGSAGLGRPALPEPITHLLEAPRGCSPPRRRPRRHSRLQPPVFSITYGLSSRIPPKRPQCFLSLTDRNTPNYQCFLSLTKKGGGGYPQFNRIKVASDGIPLATSHSPLATAVRASCSPEPSMLMYVN